MHDLQNFVAYDCMSLSVLPVRARQRPDHLVLYQCPGLDLQVGTQFIQVCLAIEAVSGLSRVYLRLDRRTGLSYYQKR
jgi:hypothetical protein